MNSSLLLLFFAVSAATLHGENWPQFRGPKGDGTSTEKNPPTQWSNTENIVWKARIPGEGHSSPIVWNGSLLVTSALENGERVLIHLDSASGKILWQKAVAAAERESMHRENSSASSTPATDGKLVITSFQVGNHVDLRAFDFSGNVVWSIQPLKFAGEHGYSYSPIIYKDLVLFDCRQEGEAALLAIEKASGKIRWRATPKKNRISHIPPLVINEGNREQIVVSGSNETASYDPKNGEQLWWCEGPSDVAVAGLSYGSGVLFATAGYPNRTRMGIRPTGRGDVTETHVLWKSPRQVTYVPSPVYHDDHFYSLVDESMMFCFNAKTGETKWEQRLTGRFRSSLVLADNYVYATNDKGVTTVFRVSSERFEQVSSNNLSEFIYATPALSNGKFYVRTGEHIYCIGRGTTL